MNTERGKCLYCASSDVTYLSHEMADGILDGTVMFNCICNDCGKTYTENYDMSYCGKTDADGEEYGEYESDDDF